MYTSGSTGMPKGVMMTHGNVLAVASAVMTIVPGLGPKDVYLVAYLPLAHILELAAENIIPAIGSSIGYGSSLTLTDTSNKVKRGTKGDASVLRPTLMAAVPAILDRVRDGVRRKIDATGGLPEKLSDLSYSRRLAAINGSWFGAWDWRGFYEILWCLGKFELFWVVVFASNYLEELLFLLTLEALLIYVLVLQLVKGMILLRPVLVALLVSMTILLLVVLVLHCLDLLLSWLTGLKVDI